MQISRAYKGFKGGREGLLSITASNVGLNSFLPPWVRIGLKPYVVGRCEFGLNKSTWIIAYLILT
jgi:hypothetical protein